MPEDVIKFLIITKVINGVPVELSNRAPTEQGAYWWSRGLGPDSFSPELREIWWPSEITGLLDRRCNVPAQRIGGFWSTSPLVPRSELDQCKTLAERLVLEISLLVDTPDPDHEPLPSRASTILSEVQVTLTQLLIRLTKK